MAKTLKKTKLLRKTSKAFLRISFVLMVISTIALFFYVRNLLQEEVEEELRSMEARIESSISDMNAIYQLPPVVEVATVAELGMEKLKDTAIFDPSQNELEDFRELTTYSEIQGQNYRITVRVLIVESEDILMALIVSYLIIILLVFIFLFYMNKERNRRLWHPFFTNLEAMKGFSLVSEKPIELLDSDILEFCELKDEITTLTEKVRADYKNLKQYTEDLSHEMQTPLAIIQARIDNIINEDNLNDIQFEHLTSIQKDIKRLTQLNKRLTLLNKIENQQFSNSERLNFNQIIRNRIETFNEIYPCDFELIERGTLEVIMDSYLADVLIDNLLANAVKYRKKGTSIVVEIEKQKFSVANEGLQKLLNPEKLFSRFYRETPNKISSGLGLAIVKKICDLYDFMPDYDFRDGRHIFTIRQKNSS
jgi:signal transduction histidine kinase